MRRDVIVIGASAGGVEALQAVVGGLPAELPAAVLVVLHIPAGNGSVLPSILDRAGPLPARHPDNGDPLTHGVVYVAPPDYHLLVRRDRVMVSRGPRESGHRPAVDVLFRSAARYLGPRAIAVVLSGTLDDGTAGLRAVAGRGGVTVAQDPADALYPSMPQTALDFAPVDHVAPAAEIGPLLAKLCQTEAVADVVDPPSDLLLETDVAMMQEGAIEKGEPPGQPSAYGCPDCGGVLWQVRDGELIRFRCRVGHAWTARSLLEQHDHHLEAALWVALRAVEEKASLARRLSEQAAGRGGRFSAARFAEAEQASSTAARLLREMLESGTGTELDGGPEKP